MSDKQIHVLEKPLRIASENQNQYYLLPAGTTLYYDASLPEGADRFYVYINVEGSPLNLTSPERPDLINPLTAYPIEDEDVLKLLKEYPISKNDLLQLLNIDTLSKEDIQDIIKHLQSL